MNTSEPPPLPQPHAVATPSPREPFAPVLLGVVAFTLLADFVLWGHTPGVSFAIFCAMIPALIAAFCAPARWSRRAWIALALFGPACVQAAVEICFTNVVVLVLLTLVLVGEMWFAALPAGWARWWEACVAFLKALGRWMWLIEEAGAQPVFRAERAGRAGTGFLRFLRVAVPAGLVGLVFTIVLANGNAVFGDLLSRIGNGFVHWLEHLDFSLGRFFFWWVIATFALVLCRPATAPREPRVLTRTPGLWTSSDLTTARWQSYATLGVVNVLFCIVNTIDAGLLWHRGKIPETVNAFDFIHEGANSLITATVLAGLVLVAIFQQAREVSGRRGVQVLALVWIAQNLVLLSSVVLRLRLYIDYSHLHTAKRIHLGCFLALVTLGFVFLVLHVVRGPDLRRLLWRNTAAVFVLFYSLQFINTTGIAAQWNLNAFAAGNGLDMAYLLQQGENAWPQLVQAAQSERTLSEVIRAREEVRKLAEQEKKRLAGQDWREVQTRRDASARRVIAAAQTMER